MLDADEQGAAIGSGIDTGDLAFERADQEPLERGIGGVLPLYRNGDTIIVAPSAPVRRGDRVVARTKAGEVMAKVLERQSPERVELRSLNPEHADRTIMAAELDWMARIIWASQ